MPNAVVFDVGGTKIATTAVDEAGNDLLDGQHRRTETPEDAPIEVFMETMAGEFEELRAEFGNVVAWGAAFPGPYKRLESGELQTLALNIPGVRGKVIERELARVLPGVPGFVDNDLKLALWGEHIAGGLRDLDDAMGFVHSTGVSTALMLGGEIVRGSDNNAGEMGCVIVERDPARARPCDAQGGREYGHLESQVRGPALAEIFFGVDRNDKRAVRSALEAATPDEKRAIVEHCVPYVTDVLAPVLQSVGVSNVMLFGGISTWLGRQYADALATSLRESSFTFRNANGSVRLAEQPNLAPLLGAADRAFSVAGVEMRHRADG